MRTCVQAVLTARAEHESQISVPHTRCAGCDGKCVTQLLASDSVGAISVPNQYIDGSGQDYSVGDNVVVSIPSSTLISLSSLIYLFPVLLMLLFGVASTHLYGGSDATVAAASMVGLGIGLTGVKLLLNRIEKFHATGVLAVRRN